MGYGIKDIDFAFMFPFTDVAKRIVGEHNAKITPELVEKAVNRINSSLQESGIGKRSIALYDSDKLLDILSYAVARMIIAFSGNTYMLKRFAISEAKRAHKYLEGLDRDVVINVSKEFGLLPISGTEPKNLKVDVFAYLRFAPKSSDYKLVNRELHNGLVRVNWHEFLRILEEAIYIKVASIPFRNPKDAPEIIRSAIKRISIPKSQVPKIIASKGFPPCIQSLISQIRQHENLGHNARWVLGVYLVRIGMDKDEIINLYSNLPDFKEKITRYHIEHIQKKGYAMPSCNTMRSYGLCPYNCGATNPLKWRGELRSEREK